MSSESGDSPTGCAMIPDRRPHPTRWHPTIRTRVKENVTEPNFPTAANTVYSLVERLIAHQEADGRESAGALGIRRAVFWSGSEPSGSARAAARPVSPVSPSAPYDIQYTHGSPLGPRGRARSARCARAQVARPDPTSSDAKAPSTAPEPPPGLRPSPADLMFCGLEYEPSPISVPAAPGRTPPE